MKCFIVKRMSVNDVELCAQRHAVMWSSYGFTKRHTGMVIGNDNMRSVEELSFIGDVLREGTTLGGRRILLMALARALGTEQAVVKRVT